MNVAQLFHPHHSQYAPSKTALISRTPDKLEFNNIFAEKI